MEIDFLNGESYFRFFKEISSIPRGSGNTEKIQKYLIKYAEQRNLDYACDEIGNVVIYKDKSADSKSNDPVILQGHMDMVTVKIRIWKMRVLLFMWTETGLRQREQA